MTDTVKRSLIRAALVAVLIELTGSALSVAQFLQGLAR